MTTHPAHDANGVAFIRCLNERTGEPIGYVNERGNYWDWDDGEMFRPLRFGSVQAADAFLAANPQWQPARVESLDSLAGQQHHELYPPGNDTDF